MTQRTQTPVTPRPFLKWAGGKSQLIEQYKPLFPKGFKNYYEPFLGGGAVFFYLHQQFTGFNAFLSDINPELINVYCCVRDDVETLIDLLDKHQLKHGKIHYYQVRGKLFRRKKHRAARLIYLNKTCFNGLYRENSKGEFNVPMGRYKNPKICNADLLRSVSEALTKAEINLQPFDAVLEQAKTADDFVYFDPPYYPLNPTSNFTAYSRYSFNEESQKKLRDTFAELSDRNVRVMLSNSDCEFIRNLYKDFHIHTVYATRSINSKGKKRGKISEVVVTSY
ncbi:DNA adenine methylase [Phormidium sp. CCY1219]|uniref:DNA adenine methylase n=1 Tax=Phormidium sp. CCY1219 TaxID=2886104 RepID=UPI002D1E538F|nr:DNA adenine methylase [Phormidium sp. CCY1219]MEB3830359.1 DNA adenine methylase [Phormidium sp. CCY1219]